MIWLYYNKYKGYIQIYYMISKYLFYHIIRIQRGCDHPRKLDDFRVDTPEASTASAQNFCQVQCPRFEANSPAVDAKTQPMIFFGTLCQCDQVVARASNSITRDGNILLANGHNTPQQTTTGHNISEVQP